MGQNVGHIVLVPAVVFTCNVRRVHLVSISAQWRIIEPPSQARSDAATDDTAP